MGEAAKKICLASLKDQSCLEKSTALQPYSFMAPSKLSISVDSPFKPWKNPSSKSLDASERHNHPQLEPQHAISNNSSMLAANHHEKIIENPTLDQAEKNLINGSFVTDGVGANVNTSHICEGKANEPNLHLNLAPKMGDDPKRLKRMIANRGYAKKHSLKKKHHIANLEKQTSSLTVMIVKHAMNICLYL
ncbi:hypothetical protein SESBI_40295 [Sesbania bispinosa]|nr:hypothetical protein SESBI_40295 [Sesbania bispinosa]